MLDCIIPLYWEKANFREPAFTLDTFHASTPLARITDVKSASLPTVANPLNKNTATAGSLKANVAAARPNTSTKQLLCLPANCKSTGSRLGDNQNGSSSGVNSCHFEPMVMQESLKYCTAKGSSVRNFRCPHTSAQWSMWQCCEDIPIMRHMRKIGC